MQTRRQGPPATAEYRLVNETASWCIVTGYEIRRWYQQFLDGKPCNREEKMTFEYSPQRPFLRCTSCGHETFDDSAYCGDGYSIPRDFVGPQIHRNGMIDCTICADGVLVFHTNRER